MVASDQSNEDRGWELLRGTHTEEALALLKNELDRERGVGLRSTVGYGAALLWTGQYRSAAENLERVIETNRKTRGPLSEDHYSLAGAGRWCLGEYPRAVELWRLGTKAPYAVYGVCLATPKLLVLSSILEPIQFAKPEAMELLKKKSMNPGVQGYPGTLAQFIAGLIDHAALDESVEQRTAREVGSLIRDRKWKVAFYDAVLDLAAGGITRNAFRKRMRSITKPSQFNDLDASEFWWLTRSAEFYIARHEARSTRIDNHPMNCP
jgi:tetratricopeptide (TPR) repeat protein